MIPISKLYIGEAEKQVVMEVLDSGMLAHGPRTAKLAERFAQVCSAKHAIATSTGTTVLHLALLTHGVGPGDEVITTPGRDALHYRLRDKARLCRNGATDTQHAQGSIGRINAPRRWHYRHTCD